MNPCANHPSVEAVHTCARCLTATCSTCASLVQGAWTCPDCLAARIAPPAGPVPRVKSPFAAAFFSTILPGLGQVYNGLLPRGLAQFLVAFVAIRLTTDMGVFAALVVLATIVFWVWQIVDAWGTAEDINRLGRVPDEDEAAALGRGPLPGLDGSRRTLGVFLVIAGVLLLLHEFDVARAVMRVVDVVWPWALVAGGAWLLWKNRTSASRGAAPDAGPEEDSAHA